MDLATSSTVIMRECSYECRPGDGAADVNRAGVSSSVTFARSKYRPQTEVTEAEWKGRKSWEVRERMGLLEMMGIMEMGKNVQDWGGRVAL